MILFAENVVQNIPNCYLTTSSADIYPDEKKVCVTLLQSGSDLCNYLPEGVYVAFRLDNMEYEQTVRITDFSYKTTGLVCFVCKSPNNC